MLRSPYAHARITRLDPTRARTAGVVGVLTGATSPSSPARSRQVSTRPSRTTLPRTRRRGTWASRRGGRRPRPLLAEDATRADRGRVRAARARARRRGRRRRPACVSDRSFSYGDVDRALATADLVVRERFRFPRWSCTPVECYGVVCDWNAAEGSLTAWANFQGPFTLHSVAAAALGLPGSKLRLITPRRLGGSFGIKSAVFAYAVLMGLASRKLGVPVRWIEDRLEHLAASSASSGRLTHVEAGFSSTASSSLRYDAIEDVGAYVRARRAGDALPDARLACRRVPRPERRRSNRVVLTNTLPSGLNRGFGGPQLYLALERTMTIAANRLGLDPAECGGGTSSATSRTARRRARLYDSGDYEGCLDDALELARYDVRRAEASAARADGRLVGVGIACVVEPSISNMGYITLAEPATRGLPKSGNAEGCSISISALGGIIARSATTPQGQGHRTVIAQVVADRLGVEPADVDVLTEVDTSTSPWTIASGNYSSRFSGGVGAVAAAAERLGEKVDAICSHLGDENASLRRIAGTAHWNPEALPPGMDGGLAVTAYWAAPNLLPPDARTASRLPQPTASSPTSRSSRSIARPVEVLDGVTVHDAGRLLNPLLAEGQVRGGLAHGAAAALFERHVWDEDGNSSRARSWTTSRRPRPTCRPALGHRESPSPFLPLGAKGLGEGTTMSVPAAIANASRTPRARRRRAAVHTGSRLGAAAAMKPGAVRLRAAEVSTTRSRRSPSTTRRRCSQADRASCRR